MEEEIKSLLLAAKEKYFRKATDMSRRGAERIVHFYGATYCRLDVCIFMEYMEGKMTSRFGIELRVSVLYPLSSQKIIYKIK